MAWLACSCCAVRPRRLPPPGARRTAAALAATEPPLCPSPAEMARPEMLPSCTLPETARPKLLSPCTLPSPAAPPSPTLPLMLLWSSWPCVLYIGSQCVRYFADSMHRGHQWAQQRTEPSAHTSVTWWCSGFAPHGGGTMMLFCQMLLYRASKFGISSSSKVYAKLSGQGDQQTAAPCHLQQTRGPPRSRA